MKKQLLIVTIMNGLKSKKKTVEQVRALLITLLASLRLEW